MRKNKPPVMENKRQGKCKIQKRTCRNKKI